MDIELGKTDIRQVLDLLIETYGSRELKPHQDPVGELVLTILSQNTSDKNSRPAFSSLISACKTWEDIIQSDQSFIAETIKKGGLAQIKARRIQEALNRIKLKQGSFDLTFLETLPVSAARQWLMDLPGVGEKTAGCVLLFSFGRPVLPVDTHIFRVSKRLGLIPDKASLKEAHSQLGTLKDPDLVYQFHVLMIEQGRKVCLARNPRCSHCGLNSICLYYTKLRADQL